MKNFNPNIRFAQSDSMNVPGYGWCREYLGQVCDIIRRMIRKWIPGPAGTVLSCFLQLFYVLFLFPWCAKRIERTISVV